MMLHRLIVCCSRSKHAPRPRSYRPEVAIEYFDAVLSPLQFIRPYPTAPHSPKHPLPARKVTVRTQTMPRPPSCGPKVKIEYFGAVLLTLGCRLTLRQPHILSPLAVGIRLSSAHTISPHCLRCRKALSGPDSPARKITNTDPR